MFKRLIQWLKSFFQGLLGAKKTTSRVNVRTENQPPPTLDDTDLEFLFTELLEGVYQARGQAWALRWLNNIEHRVPESRWLEWLQKFGARLLASSSANNEIASRMVSLGELEIGPVGDTAYDLGMQLLRRNQPEPIWEYAGPDATNAPGATGVTNTYENINFPDSQNFVASSSPSVNEPTSEAPNVVGEENQPPTGEEGEYQTITLEQLFELLQQDASLRQMIAQQVGVESDDPEIIIQAVVNQLQTAGVESGDKFGE